MTTTIAPQELLQRHQSQGHLELIDVRTPAEFHEVHVTFAQNTPLDRLDAAALAQRHRDADQPLYVICKSGSRGQMACQKLTAAGISHVINVAGGTVACVEAGLPVKRGRPAMSLERQVRIAAGAFVLIGAIPALLGYPAMAGLSAFIGAGLMFAGITDTCGMGMVLARMPWNQRPCS